MNAADDGAGGIAGPLDVLCAGAAKGLVEALATQLAPAVVQARFGAVGAMRDALRGGTACDVFIVTDAMAAAMEDSSELLPGSLRALGRVRTGIAVASSSAWPAIGQGAALAQSLLAASALYFPDAERSTAGAHFVSVLERLGIRGRVAERFRMFPNGATAMAALAAAADPGAIGCTQVTEIRYTPGIELVGVLPAEFELATVYSAAIAAGSRHGDEARRFIELLTGSATQALRESGGFELDAHHL